MDVIGLNVGIIPLSCLVFTCFYTKPSCLLSPDASQNLQRHVRLHCSHAKVAICYC